MSKFARAIADVVSEELTEGLMASGNKSLRSVLARWLLWGPEKLNHVTKFRTGRTTHKGYESIKTYWAGGQVAIFFRHQDGSWHANPSARETEIAEVQNIEISR